MMIAPEIRMPAVLMPDLARPVRQYVEGNFDFHPTLDPENIDSLIASQLSRTGKRRGAAAEIQYGRSKPIRIELRIVFHDCEDPLRLSSKDEA